MVALQNLSRRQALKIAKVLLDAGADIDALDEDLSTPLHWASSVGFQEMMQLLFERGANIYARDRYGETPLILENLTHPGRSQGFRFRRVKSGEHNNRNYKGTDADYLHLSHQAHAKSADPGWFRNSLTNLDVFGNSAWNAWMASWNFNRGQLISCLRDNCTTDESKRLLWEHSPRFGNISLYHRIREDAALLKATLYLKPDDVSLNKRSEFYNTPLWTAAALGRCKEMYLLIRAGANIDQVSGENGTTPEGACQSGRLPAVKLLISCGARTRNIEEDDGPERRFLVYRNSQHHPKVRNWLLNGRFQETPKIDSKPPLDFIFWAASFQLCTV